MSMEIVEVPSDTRPEDMRAAALGRLQRNYLDGLARYPTQYPALFAQSDIRACQSEGELIRAAWRWWSTDV